MSTSASTTPPDRCEIVGVNRILSLAVNIPQVIGDIIDNCELVGTVVLWLPLSSLSYNEYISSTHMYCRLQVVLSWGFNRKDDRKKLIHLYFNICL
jgi:hypothetical protein